jgi:hypothetical protein
MDVVKDDKELIAFTPEIDCNQTAVDLPPAMSAVITQSLIILVKPGCLGGTSEIPLWDKA